MGVYFQPWEDWRKCLVRSEYRKGVEGRVEAVVDGEFRLLVNAQVDVEVALRHPVEARNEVLEALIRRVSRRSCRSKGMRTYLLSQVCRARINPSAQKGQSIFLLTGRMVSIEGIKGVGQRRRRCQGEIRLSLVRQGWCCRVN